MIKVYKKEYKGWKDCVFITNEKVELAVTTAVGPRIIRYGFIGKENMMYEDPALLGKTGGDTWLNYGGHRLWHSPEMEVRTYVPDNKPYDYTLLKNGIATVQYETEIGIEKRMEITMAEDGGVQIKHMVKNTNYWEIELAAWSLTVLSAGGLEAVPVLRGPEALLPDRTMTLWPYAVMNDERVYFGADLITLEQNPKAERNFKIGLPNTSGIAVYFNHNQLFVKEHVHDDEATYPDGNCSFETYTNKAMLEMETLSPLVLLGKDEEIQHVERWRLFDNVERPASRDEKAVLGVIKNYTENI